MERAAQLAAFAQTLARVAVGSAAGDVTPDLYLVHSYNRFQACRHGFAGRLVDATSGHDACRSRDDLRETLRRLAPHAQVLGSQDALDALRRRRRAKATTRRGCAHAFAETGRCPTSCGAGGS